MIAMIYGGSFRIYLINFPIATTCKKTVAAGKPRRIAARVAQGKAALLKEQNDVGRMILNIGKVQPWALLF